jgi:hypothetical protein
MNKQQKWDIWDDHITKIITLSDMIHREAWDFIHLHDSGYPDEVIEALTNKLKVDLRALYHEAKQVQDEVE